MIHHILFILVAHKNYSNTSLLNVATSACKLQRINEGKEQTNNHIHLDVMVDMYMRSSTALKKQGVSSYSGVLMSVVTLQLSPAPHDHLPCC